MRRPWHRAASGPTRSRVHTAACPTANDGTRAKSRACFEAEGAPPANRCERPLSGERTSARVRPRRSARGLMLHGRGPAFPQSDSSLTLAADWLKHRHEAGCATAAGSCPWAGSRSSPHQPTCMLKRLRCSPTAPLAALLMSVALVVLALAAAPSALGAVRDCPGNRPLGQTGARYGDMSVRNLSLSLVRGSGGCPLDAPSQAKRGSSHGSGPFTRQGGTRIGVVGWLCVRVPASGGMCARGQRLIGRRCHGDLAIVSACSGVSVK